MIFLSTFATYLNKNIMNINELLRNPLKDNGKNIQKTFSQIAENLFQNFCIQCGEKKYYFAEIEFYYYDKTNFDEEWNKKTYPRTDKAAGVLFFHYSGFDICFESDFKKGVFGGILIRSLFDKKNNRFITGPLLCVNEVLNACSNTQKWPEIVELSSEEKLYQSNNCVINDPPRTRYGITYKDKELQDVPWCFFDKRLLYEKNQKNTFENSTWDYVKKEAKDSIRYYHRFDSK